MREPIWRPTADRIANSNIARYLEYLKESRGLTFSGFHDLYRWSTQNIGDFWESIWHFSEIRSSHSHSQVNLGDQMWGNDWFLGAKLNFAENLLRIRDDRPAIIARNESGQRRCLSCFELYRQVTACASALKAAGVNKGDRVAAFIPNIPEAVIAMLATTSLGAIWSSCSPDFGKQGVLDRFTQIEPKVLFAVDGYRYAGKSVDTWDRVRQVASQLPSLSRVVVIPQLDERSEHTLSNGILWDDFLDPDATEIDFVQTEFDHPVYILYSSGTTDKPKCIVHGAGGTLLQHFKEHSLHCDLKPRDVISYYTTCGWMMWNWLVSALFEGATIFLYDGSPSYPNIEVLWDAIDDDQIAIFGTSPKFLQSCQHLNLSPKNTHSLRSLRTILSTGSPLPESSYEWVYGRVKADVLLSSILGGTDIVSCFMLGSPTLPVYRGEIQTRGLGMKVECYDESGRPLIDEVGELVCTAPFPSQPVCFWNDPDGSQYHSAYFEHFPGVWRHGDYIQITRNGGVVVYGRSDATLNSGGVRIGTAEIYGPVEDLPEIADSLVIDLPRNESSEIVLFVVLQPPARLDDSLAAKIKQTLRDQQSPRHVPARIFEISEVPRTISGKKVELAVKRILSGQEVTNREAVANPDSLRQFERLRLR